MKNADYEVTIHGSVTLCLPLNNAAREHLREHVSDEAIWFAGRLVVEPRYVHGLVAGLTENGWEVIQVRA